MWASGWSAAAAQAGWQSFAIRRLDQEVWGVGVVQKATAWVNPETILTLPTGWWPTGLAAAQQRLGDVTVDAMADGRVRMRAAGGPGVTAIGFHYILG